MKFLSVLALVLMISNAQAAGADKAEKACKNIDNAIAKEIINLIPFEGDFSEEDSKLTDELMKLQVVTKSTCKALLAE